MALSSSPRYIEADRLLHPHTQPQGNEHAEPPF
jgi:hypothetical protein